MRKVKIKMFSFVILISSLLISVQAGITSNITNVNKHAVNPKEFVELGGRNYYFSPNRLSKTEADIFCQDLGMEVVSIETEEESNLIINYLIETGIVRAGHWTSGVEVDGDFHWMPSDEPFTYTNWGRNEPSYDEPGSCVVLLYAEYWSDTRCAESTGYICEQLS